MPEKVLLLKEGPAARVMLNRPESYNAFDLELLRLLADHLVTTAMDDEVRAVVICGEGRAFCAGGDLKWILRHPAGVAAGFHELACRFHQAVLEIRRMSKPVVAAVNGIAAGGGFSLALACDFRVMARSALLRQSYTASGLCPDGGLTYSLPRLVGLARALEIVAFDQPISADQALSWGLATRVAEDGRALEEAVNMAAQLGRGSLNGYGWAKKLLTESFDTSLETQLEREREGIRRCGEHPEGREGMRAFSEKRKPVFC